VAFPIPSLADAERFVREKEAIVQYYDIMYKAREIMRRAYLKTPEGKAEARRERELAEQRRKERAEARARREERRLALAAQEAEMQRQYEERSLKLAAAKAAREARTGRDRERERRSRINWSELIEDEYIVKQQMAWERRATALAMNDAGLSFAVIGERLGISRGRANEIAKDARRERDAGIRSPAEKWMAALAVTADECGFAMRQTVAAIVPRDDEGDLIWMGLAA
jgi:hypothetical protein